MNSVPFKQPGDPEQLADVFAEAEDFYERANWTMVIYWSHYLQRYFCCRELIYKPNADRLEVIRIPK